MREWATQLLVGTNLLGKLVGASGDHTDQRPSVRRYQEAQQSMGSTKVGREEVDL
jgi:hypothetical protein